MAEVILSHPFGGTKVDLMKGECWIHKDKNRKVIVLMPPSRGRDTLLFALKQIHLAERKILRTFQSLRSMREQKRCRCQHDTFFTLTQIILQK